MQRASGRRVMSNMFEDAVTKAVAKLGSIKAKVNGLDGVFRRLTEEHKEVAILLQRAGMSTDAEKRAELWSKIREQLTAHEQAELQVVYTAFEAYPALTELVRQHEADADKLQALITNMDTSPAASAQWEGCLRQLEHAVLKHAEREEEEFFPRAQEIIGEDRAQQLEYPYLQARKVILRGAL